MSRCKACNNVLLSTTLKSKRTTPEGYPDFEDMCNHCISQMYIHMATPIVEYTHGFLENPIEVIKASSEGSSLAEEVS